MSKAIVSGTEGRPTLTPGGHQQLNLCVPGGLPATVLQGRDVLPPGTQTKSHRPTEERVLGNLLDRSFYLINLSPEFCQPSEQSAHKDSVPVSTYWFWQ